MATLISQRRRQRQAAALRDLVARFTSLRRYEQHLRTQRDLLGELQAAKREIDRGRTSGQMDRWETQKWVMNTRQEADRQIAFLENFDSKVEKEYARKRKKKLSAEAQQNLTSLFEATCGTRPDSSAEAILDDYRRCLGTKLDEWRVLARDVAKMGTNVFSVDILYYISRRSGLESASLAVAFIIAMGAVQMALFYGAIGIQISKYWTVEDLIIQGVMVSPILLVMLLLCEMLFRLRRSRLEKDTRRRHVSGVQRAYRWVGPGKAGTTFVAVALVAIMLTGHFSGKLELEKERVESASVLGRIPLENVLLVGTTSTTAVFLRDSTPSKPSEDAEIGWLTDALCSYSFSGNVATQAARFVQLDWNCPRAKDADHEVMVFDRAHVTCHGAGSACLNIEARTEPVVAGT